jgi:hypothetical protein
MNIDQLHQLHMDKLINSFGVSTALGAFRDDRAARALGNHYSDSGSHDTSKEEV